MFWLNWDDTEYVDEDVETGEEYEYYVVAYDKAGNRSSKSIKQNVKISGEKSPDPSVDLPESPDKPQAGKSDFNLQKVSKSTIKLYTLDDDFNVIAMVQNYYK